MNEVTEQIESSNPNVQAGRPMSPEAELVFNLINGINQSYLAGLSHRVAGAPKK